MANYRSRYRTALPVSEPTNVSRNTINVEPEVVSVEPEVVSVEPEVVSVEPTIEDRIETTEPVLSVTEIPQQDSDALLAAQAERRRRHLLGYC